jgi:MOSC domain-containing protein YiiM
VAFLKENQDKKGRVFSINYSKTKGTGKTTLKEAKLIEGFGVEGDAHGGAGLRQVSLLAIESIRKQTRCPKAGKKKIALGPGDFAENITTESIEPANLKIGDILKVGKEAELQISKIGKECHRFCSIYYKIGDCIMPREGIFARVLKGGRIKAGESIQVIASR